MPFKQRAKIKYSQQKMLQDGKQYWYLVHGYWICFHGTGKVARGIDKVSMGIDKFITIWFMKSVLLLAPRIIHILMLAPRIIHILLLAPRIIHILNTWMLVAIHELSWWTWKDRKLYWKLDHAWCLNRRFALHANHSIQAMFSLIMSLVICFISRDDWF